MLRGKYFNFSNSHIGLHASKGSLWRPCGVRNGNSRFKTLASSADARSRGGQVNLRPSSLPILSACPCYVSKGDTEHAEAGRDRHKMFAELIRTAVENLDEVKTFARLGKHDADDYESCKWAADYFMLKAALKDFDWQSETKMSFVLPDFTEIEGTPDVVCGPDLFDLKSRERDYKSQMAAYALMIFEAHPEFEFVRVHLLFTATKRIIEYTLTPAEALEIVTEVIGNAMPHEGKQPEPKACDYCGWCAKALTCPAVAGRAEQVAVGYSDKSPEINITDWHPSQMETAEQIALGLTIWRKILKRWGESMEFHAMEAVTKRGLQLPGFKLEQREGKTTCTDVAQAFSLAGLPQDQFMRCCDIRMETSKKYPDRLGLSNAYAEFLAMKKAPAKKELLAKLAPVLSRGNPAPRLVEEKGGDEDNE